MKKIPFELEIIEERPEEIRMVVNFGPSHPATHGTLRNLITIEGERVVECEPEIGFLHTGFEKIGESLTYNQFVPVTDRMNYLSSINNNIGFVLAVEELFGIDVPERCKFIRVILAELGRIFDHIISIGFQALDLGAFTPFLWAFIERERIYDIFEEVCGARLTTSYPRVGGLMRDVSENFCQIVEKALNFVEKTTNDIDYLLTNNKLFLNRTKGVGVITRQEAIEYAVCGPVLRASGIQHDIRRARPYLNYQRFDFQVALEHDGDVYARYKVRLFEIRQSIKIIRQALKDLPSGPVNVDDPRIIIPPKPEVYNSAEGLIYHFKCYMVGEGHGICPPEGEIYSATEAPNGELGFYIISDGTQKPYRMRVKGPSFYNYQIFPKLCKQGMLADIVANLSSLNIIVGELDR